MSELAHGAMLVGALGGAACVAIGRRTALDVAASAGMLAAMADMAFTRLVHPLAWTAVLAGLGIALGARLRPAPGALEPGLPHRRGHALHRALAFIVGAWAFAAAGSAPTAGTASAPADGHVHADPGVAGLAFIAAATAMTAFGGWLVAAEIRARRADRGARTESGRPGSVRHAAEAASTTVMLAAMAVPGVIAALG